MKSLITRQQAPAALPRTGRSASALPNDPGLDSLLADTGIGSTAKTIALALVKHWAWYKPSCFPSDKTIAAKVGKSSGHVQRCLRQLESAGWIEREHTPEVRSGRRIWLLWRCPGGGQGAQPASAPARGHESVPARGERVVVKQGGVEQEVRPTPERQRSEPPATVIANPMVRVWDKVVETIEQPATATPEAAPSPGGGYSPTPPPSTPPRDRETITRPQEAIQPAVPMKPVSAFQEAAQPLKPSRATSVPTSPPPDGMPLAGLSLEEQARLRQLPEATQKRILTWLRLDDRICLGEARKLLAPPPPPEPPPRSLPTPELLASLPGRPDRIAAAAGRLAEDLKDPKSYNFYQSVVTAVCSRRHSASALVTAWRQGMNPKSERPGAVFSVAWRRETASG